MALVDSTAPKITATKPNVPNTGWGDKNAFVSYTYIMLIHIWQPIYH